MAAAVAETGIRGHGRSMAYFTLYSQWMGTCRRLLGFLGPYRRKLMFASRLARDGHEGRDPGLIGEA